MPDFVVTNETEYQRLEEIFADLFKKDRSPKKDKLFNLLANLLEDYQGKTLPELGQSTPIDTLKFLIDENDLKQTDLTDICKTQSIVSETLAGKRRINLGQAKRLANRFRVSVELFI